MLLRLPNENLLKRTTVILLTVMIQNVVSKPQDSGVLENVASQALSVATNMAEMVSNAGILSKKMGIEVPFAKANSETTVGTGAAIRNGDDDSDEDRRKRSIDFQIVEDSLKEEEYFLGLPFYHQQLHRGKRSPCHHFGSGGSTGGGGGTPAGGDDLDVAERRRRAYARRRKAAARRRTRTNKKRLINEDDNANQVLTRRKRQSELDDLNPNMARADKDFTQPVQQITEKLRQVWEGFMNSMNAVAQKITQHLKNSTSQMEI